MKNLKKILSLSLAIVMLFGVMIFPASATDSKMTYADLVDKDEIENLAEVALLVDLGIIEGKTGNVYDPTGIVDRATMAKLVTVLRTGSNVQDSFVGTVSDLTDISGNWAEGFILYCYSQSIIAGNGLGQFNPSNQVTVAEAAKMLLVTLGYDADKAGLVGSDWSINTIAKAGTAGLFNGMSGMRGTDPLDRDTLALMMYNTLFAREVTYSTIFGSEEIVKNNTLGLSTYGLVKVSGIVASADDDGFTFVSGTVTTEPETELLTSFAGTTYKLGGQQAFVGKYATGYVQVATQIEQNTSGLNLAASVTVKSPLKISSVYSSELTLAEDTGTVTSFDGTSFATLVEGSKAISRIDSDTVYFVNGVAWTPTFLNTSGKLIESDDDDWTGEAKEIVDFVADKGNVIAFTDNDGDGYADVVRVTAYTYTTVGTVATSGDVTFGGTITSKNDSTISARKWTADTIVDMDGLEEDDYVYTYVNADGDLVVSVAEKVEGSVTAVPNDGKSVSVDGTKYTYATNAVKYSPATKDEVIVHLDNNGLAIGLEKVSAADLSYVYLDSVLKSTGLSGTQAASAYFTDGSNEEIAIIELDDNAMSDATSGSNLAVAGNIYKYSVNSKGQYELTSLVTGIQKTVTTGSFTNGKAAVTESSATLFSISTATIVVNVDTGDSYTGYRNVPTMDGMTGVYALKSTSATVADVVFLTDTSLTAENKDTFVIYNAASFTEMVSDGSTYYQYKAVINGEVDVVDVTTTIHSKIQSDFNVTSGSTITRDKNALWLYVAKSTQTVGDVDCVATFDSAYKNGNSDDTALDTNGVEMVTHKDIVVSFSNGIIDLEVGADYAVDDDTLYVLVEYVSATGAVATADADRVSWDLDNGLGAEETDSGAVFGDPGSDDTKSLASVVYVHAKDGVAQVVYILANTYTD